MVEYQAEQVVPFPTDRVWKLLERHLDDASISNIHPLIRSQRTLSRAVGTTVVERTIEARGRALVSEWKVDAHPPHSFRWEIVKGEGPYSVGSWLENTYSTQGSGTLIRTRGEIRISIVPFFLPQRRLLNGVFARIDDEDDRALRA